jgi:hypothetical protein
LVKALLEAQLAEQARVQPLVGAWSWETALRRSLRRYPFNTDAVAEWRGAIEEVLSTPKTVPMPFFVAVAGTNKMHGALITFDEFADWMGVAGKQIRKREARRWLKRNNPKSGSYPAAVSWADSSQGGSGRVILATT